MKLFSGGDLIWGRLFQHQRALATSIAVLICCAVFQNCTADQLEMKNGDHYQGKVVTVTTNTVIFQSEVLGTVTLAREKVAAISLGSSASTNANVNVNAQASPPAAVGTNASNPHQNISAALKQLGTNNSTMKQVEQELLSGSPEAKAKFNEMMTGLMTGKLTVNDIRAQARAAADQLKDIKRELGDEAGTSVDGYLAILENFLKESGDAAAAPKTKSKSSKDE